MSGAYKYPPLHGWGSQAARLPRPVVHTDVATRLPEMDPFGDRRIGAAALLRSKAEALRLYTREPAFWIAEVGMPAPGRSGSIGERVKQTPGLCGKGSYCDVSISVYRCC